MTPAGSSASTESVDALPSQRGEFGGKICEDDEENEQGHEAPVAQDVPRTVSGGSSGSSIAPPAGDEDCDQKFSIRTSTAAAMMPSRRREDPTSPDHSIVASGSSGVISHSTKSASILPLRRRSSVSSIKGSVGEHLGDNTHCTHHCGTCIAGNDCLR